MNIHIEPLLTAYLKELTIQKKGTRGAVYALKKYRTYCEEHSHDLRYLTLRDAQEFYNTLSTQRQKNGTLRSSSDIGVIMSYVTSFYDFLKRRKVIVSNPFTEIKRIKKEKKIPRNILKEEELQRVLAWFRDFNKGETTRAKVNRYRVHVVAELLYACGARISEILSLKEEDIDFERSTIILHESKTGQIRECVIHEYARNILQTYVTHLKAAVTVRAHHKSSALLFGSKDYLKRLMNRMLERACGELGLAVVSSHVFRHAVGCHFLKQGCDIRYIQHILGHRKLDSTQIYTQVDKEDLLKIIDVCHPRGGKR